MFYWNLLIITVVLFGGYYLLKWLGKAFNWAFHLDEIFGDPPPTYRYTPPSYSPPKPLDTAPVEEYRRPTFKFWGKKISDYLVDPNTKILEVFVASNAADEFIQGNMTYSETSTEVEFVKLVRSGSGFRVFNHPVIPNGKWLSCR